MDRDKARKVDSLPVHKVIRSDIERKILSNEWPPGFKIPSEHQLMEQYGCARMTVNKALTSLAQAGFLSRNRRGGTVVTYPDGHTAILRIPDPRKAVLNAGHPYRYQLLAQEQRDITAKDAEFLREHRPGKVVDLTGVHYADEAVFAWETRQISLTAVPEAGEVDFARVPPSVWLLTHVPWNNATHTIRAKRITPELAKLAALPLDTPCLELERQTWNNLGPISHSIQLIVSDSFELQAQFLVNSKT